MSDPEIQEIQGLYGPFTLSERVIQKIWLRQDFAKDALRTASGQTLAIKDPGRWNLLDGPDFKEARLLIDGREIIGDVEIHFNIADWFDHQHEQNAAYNRVVLHVVLHASDRRNQPAHTHGGREPEVLVLLPLLERDLEAYVMDEALLELEHQDELEWVAEFLEKPLETRLEILAKASAERWEQKVAFAELRLRGSSWDAVCHQYAMEVLGYARNRAPMSRLALKYSLADFSSGDLSAEDLFLEAGDTWQLSGLRPANQPRRRLAQYLAICRHRPDWPSAVKALLEALREAADAPEETPGFRKWADMPGLRARLSEDVFGGELGEKRLNTLVCDAFLPLAAAVGRSDVREYWKHWSPGDAPDALTRFLKHAQITDRKRPLSNGWSQGALALFLARGF